jgi:iron complex outermembrane receptor protein
VLLDGRTVYTPVFSGVYWDVQDTMLEDLDRVEVIRGPGAAMWGANAVNGVISVTSKPAQDTQGLLVTGGGGTEERGFAGVRYGGQLGKEAAYRVYGKWFERDDSAYANGDPGQDSWRMFRGGFRTDWHPGEDNLVTFQGDLYGGEVAQVFAVTSPMLQPNGQFHTNQLLPYDVSGGNVIGRWSHTFSGDSSVQVQAYYDRTERRIEVDLQEHDTFDVDAQHRFQIGERHDVVWGLGYRLIQDNLPGTYTMNFVPAARTLDLFSAFAQDEIALVEEKLELTLGTRVERNDFTGVEVQPNARLFWRATPEHGLWGAVSRAVRTPSRAERDGLLHQPGPVFPLVTELRGNPDFQSEFLIAGELGHRWQPHRRLALETAVFYNAYDDLRSLEPGMPEPGFPTIIPVTAANLLEGDAYGLEIGPRYQALDWWALEAAYTFLNMDLDLKPGSRDSSSVQDEDRVPHHQFSLHSRMDFGRHWEVDAAVRFVDELPDFQIDSYLAMDVRVAWKPTGNLEIALVGQNLLDDRHPEFTSSLVGTQSTEVESSVYARLTLRY